MIFFFFFKQPIKTSFKQNESPTSLSMRVDGFSVSVVLLHVLKYCIIAKLLGALFFLTNVRNSFANSSPTCHPSSFIFPMTMPCSPEILPPSYHFIYFFLCLALRNTISMRKVQRVSHVYFIYLFSLEQLCRSGQSW